MRWAKWSFWIEGLALGLVCLFPTLAGAQGGGSGAFMQLGVGSRALSMGGAFTGVADDAAAVYWNPAGTGMTHPMRRQGMLMYRTMSADRRQAFIAYTQNLAEGRGGMGIALLHVGVDNIDGRDLNGQQTGLLSDSENAFLFSFSPAIHPKISFGLTMKLLVYRLAGQSAKGFGGDIGLLVHPVAPFRIGLMWRDVGTRITWDTEGLFARTIQRKETFPRAVIIGVSYEALPGKAVIAADVERAQRQDTRIRLGAEWTAIKGIAVRTGVNHGHLAAGTGFETDFRAVRLRLNYVFLSDRIDAGNTHVIEWEIRF